MDASNKGLLILLVLLSNNKITTPPDDDVVAKDKFPIVPGLDMDNGISIYEDASTVEFVLCIMLTEVL